jgi:hypothetical protein
MFCPMTHSQAAVVAMTATGQDRPRQRRRILARLRLGHTRPQIRPAPADPSPPRQHAQKCNDHTSGQQLQHHHYRPMLLRLKSIKTNSSAPTDAREYSRWQPRERIKAQRYKQSSRLGDSSFGERHSTSVRCACTSRPTPTHRARAGRARRSCGGTPAARSPPASSRTWLSGRLRRRRKRLGLGVSRRASGSSVWRERESGGQP